MERIICAANWYNDGKEHTHQPINVKKGFVVCGRRHHNCIHTFAQIVGFPYNEEGNRIHRTEVQGFLTASNKFVGRKEAYQIALTAKQIIHNIPLDNSVGLTSEDLY